MIWYGSQTRFYLPSRIHSIPCRICSDMQRIMHGSKPEIYLEQSGIKTRLEQSRILVEPHPHPAPGHRSARPAPAPTTQHGRTGARQSSTIRKLNRGRGYPAGTPGGRIVVGTPRCAGRLYGIPHRPDTASRGDQISKHQPAVPGMGYSGLLFAPRKKRSVKWACLGQGTL